MVDFKKRISKNESSKKTNPIEIYDSLDRASDKGPLRPAQQSILDKWFQSHRAEKDLIIKLHTGQGKTLIGLLILQSKINEGNGPAIFLCPNLLLVEQTCEQAKQFGIKYCKMDDANNHLPEDFLEGKAILIVHIQKYFTGFSVFGGANKYIELGAVVLDDSHACIDHIQGAITIKIPREDEEYHLLVQLFENDLEEQGLAKLQEIKNKVYDSILPVPYWAWTEKIKEVVKIIVDNREKKNIKFAWNIIQQEIQSCTCIISGNGIEITPNNVPIEQFGGFYTAKNRIFMSATTNNDSFFIKGLGVSKSVVTSPLMYDKEKWSGEKMILIPALIQDELNRSLIVNSFAKSNPKRKVGVIAITPSFNTAKYWEERGAIVARSNINDCIKKLKDGDFSDTIVFANRYDGIDLPDDMCRVLIMDKKPYAMALLDQYQENCRSDSDLIDIKLAQKIEQGFGRGVRGEKDYCVIVISSLDLITYIRSRKLKTYFSAQTSKQIEIGLEIATMASNDATTDKGWEIFSDLINQSLSRDEGWKEFYKERMDSIVFSSTDKNKIVEILDLEKAAEDLYSKGAFEAAANTVQRIIDLFIDKNNKNEIGWYIQEMARMTYPLSKVESNKFQINAHKHNRSLLKPISGMIFKKLEINKNRLDNIREFISRHENFNELKIEVLKLTSNISFGIKANTFEEAFCEIGKALGFESERPDNEWKQGPDNLWNIKKGQYLLFECKSEVLDTRDEIYKEETGQMNNACAWFGNHYNSDNVKNVLIIPTKNISKAAGFNEKVMIMRKSGLNKLRGNVGNFFNEFRSFDLNNLTDAQIQLSLKTHNLTEENILSDYFEEPFQRK